MIPPRVPEPANPRKQLPKRVSPAERELAQVVREILDGDTERGVLLLGPNGAPIYANSAVRTLFADGAARASNGLLPRELDAVAQALLERAGTENEPQAQELPWPSAEERRARVLIEARRRGFGWYVVVRTLRAQPGSEPTIRRLQACWQLTLREAQVAAGVARGQSNGEVATALGIVEKTVKNVLLAVYQKVGVRNRVELALRAHDVGGSTG